MDLLAAILFSLVVTPLAVYLINRLAKSVKRASRRALDEMSHLYERLSESLSAVELVKAYTMERYERRRFHQGRQGLHAQSAKNRLLPSAQQAHQRIHQHRRDRFSAALRRLSSC